MKKSQISVQGTPVTILENDFISLTDIAKKFSERTDLVIANWLRTRSTVEFLGIWETMNNPNFNPFKFEGIKMRAGTPGFAITASDWTTETNAIGIYAKPGRYGGTFAHRDIAFEFLSYLSPPFKMYFIQEFQRLKSLENRQYGSVQRNPHPLPDGKGRPLL